MPRGRGDGQRRLKGVRQSRGQIALHLGVVKLLYLVEPAEDILEVLGPYQPYGLVAWSLRGVLHALEQERYVLLVLLKVRKVLDVGERCGDRFGLLRGRESLVLPQELPERYIPPAVFCVSHVGEDEGRQVLVSVPVRARGLARQILFEPVSGGFVRIGDFLTLAFTVVNQRGVGVKKSKRAHPVQRVEELPAHRQGDGDAGPFRQGGAAFLVLDANRPGGVYPRTYLVAHAAPLYDGGLPPTQGVRDADNGLESITLCAARGAAVGALVRDADVVV